MKRLIRATCAVATGLAVCTTPALSQSVDAPSSYAVLTQVDTTAQTTLLRELVSMRSGAGASVVTIDGTHGAASLNVQTAADGELVLTDSAASSDPGIVCYNMAQALLSAAAQKRPTATLAIVFVGRAVPVTMALHESTTKDGSTVENATGETAGVITNGADTTPGGVLVSAQISERFGTLVAARFASLSLIGSPAHATGRTVCSLENVRKEPATPAGSLAI